MMKDNILHNAWKTAVLMPAFKKSLYLAIFLIVVLICFFPFYFAKIEARQGYVMSDPLLDWIPAHDVSLLIFMLLYGGLSWMIVHLVKDPHNCLVFIWTYIFLCLMRIVTIGLVPLNAPAGLIELRDPMSILFYHTKSITKDLFFSGHTSIMFLGALFQKKLENKRIGFAMVLLMAGLLLVQHIHYTIDIVFAPLFSFLACRLAKYYFSFSLIHENPA